MHKVRKRTAVEGWSWEAEKRQSACRDRPGRPEFPLRPSDEGGLRRVHSPVLYVGFECSLRDPG